MMMLGAPRRGWFMRANIWPSAQEAVMRESGEAAFVYGLAHDHNFDFLTVGYFGPGYRSDHYEVDPARIIGKAGDAVDLRFVGSSVLHLGRVMHYRARRDVHCQYPPE
ncbi:MAG: transposase, partial [Blastomonas sp.]|nr:transposase [Blastomonas sp.]